MRTLGFHSATTAPLHGSAARYSTKPRKRGWVLGIVLLTSCRPSPAPLTGARSLPAPVAAATPTQPAPQERAHEPEATEPPELPAGWQRLAVEGAADAVLFVPHHPATHVLVVTHGAGGTPEAHCEAWAARTHEDALLLCPRGKEMVVGAVPAAYYYPDHHALEAEVLAGVAALERAAPHTRSLTWSYVGYSQGANMGSLMILDHLDRFATLCFTEGGVAEWSEARAQRAATRAGLKIAFVCGTQRCTERARRSVRLLERHGVATKLAVAPGAGHRPDGPVGTALDGLVPWLLNAPEPENAQDARRLTR